MAFKMRSGNSPLEFKQIGSSPVKQKTDKEYKEIAGEGTGVVKEDDKGEKYTIYGGRRAETGEYAAGYGGGFNPWTGKPSAMPGDTIFVGGPGHLRSSMPWIQDEEGNYIRPDLEKQAEHEGDDFIGGGEYEIEETESSKKRTKGPRSYTTK